MQLKVMEQIQLNKLRGFRIEDVRTGNGIFDVKDIRFSPEDFAQFNINKFMNKLGIGKATEDLGRDKIQEMLGKARSKRFLWFY